MDAVTYFDEGFNCAEAVLLALSESFGIPRDCIPRVATGFGGGMRMGNVCGAVSGAVMAFGFEHGRDSPGQVEKRDKVYTLVRELMTQFEKEHKTIICRELLGVNVGTEEGLAQYREKNMHEQCRNYVRSAFTIAHSLLAPE